MTFGHMKQHRWNWTVLSGVKQIRECQIWHIITYTWNLKYKMNITKLKKGHRYRKQISSFQWGNGREEKQDRGKRGNIRVGD